MLSGQVKMADLKRLINTSCWYQLWTGVLVTQVNSGVAEECVVGRDDCGGEKDTREGCRDRDDHLHLSFLESVVGCRCCWR